MKKIIPPKLKATIALEAVKGVKTMNQIGSEYEAHPIQVGIWKKQLIANAHLIFSGERKEKESEQTALLERLYKIIGQRDTELDWLKKNCTLSHEERRALIVPSPDLSISRQTDLLDISRSSLYYTKSENPEDKNRRDMIDAIYYVIAWGLSLSMETEFCISTLNRALTIATPERVYFGKL